MSPKTPESEKLRLEELFREIETLNLLDTCNNKIITHDKTTELREAIDVLYYALMDFCEYNPDMGEEIDSAWKVILENIDE